MSWQHRAKPEQWERIKQLAKDDWEVQSAIYELRARVEQLEAALLSLTSTVAKAGNDHKSRIEALEAAQRTTAMEELRAASAEARPGGLVERVADAIYRNGTGDGFREEARAAIRENASWLRTGLLMHAADLLEMEADRG